MSVRWINGEHPPTRRHEASKTRRSQREDSLAQDLADVIRTLRALKIPAAARSDADLRWYRTQPLEASDAQFRAHLAVCRELPGLDLNLSAAEAVWKAAMELPETQTTEHWVHCDLVAENLLQLDGHLCGVLDFGTLSVGDPAVELHGAWELFDPAALQHFRSRLGVSDSQWLQGRAWALAIALGCLAYYWDKLPSRRHDRLAMAHNVLYDAAGDGF